ncbi:glycosyltransferase family 4 protein [Jiella sonneratiae]|uniref:Glycosyltransferase family 4 protein n=1 Tax=Jiella sonneratiae TaxID=2816856 RepID=A0ABS3J3S4_9HYPH|nr:glycosyltransferase family 4 protein [Jiella sonneratiae]MBO0904325.1 glycosyltransferase family 4 protein [Jiella sonneratiae]
MRIAFHAPMKAPDDPVPSGDRLVARNLVAALERGGHEATLAARFRSYDRGDPERQARLELVGRRLAGRLVCRLTDPALRPDLWFTYHLYHKAPDHLGPAVSAALDIPYVVAEASVAGKQRGGPFDRGFRASLAALARADLVVTLNPGDAAGVAPHLRPGVAMLSLPPFIDGAPFAAARRDREAARAELARRFTLDTGRIWLVAAAMMRADQKLASYRLLADALGGLGGAPFELLVAGAGPAEAAVRSAFADAGIKAHFLGEVPAGAMPALLAASDLYVWPAVKEAFGMALIEAQAAGLPVVAGASPGVASVVEHDATGLLVPPGDAAAFGAGVASLLNPRRRAEFSAAARRRALATHDIAGAAARLGAALSETCESFRAARSLPRFLPRSLH